jgi:hypothetical protein
MGFERELRTVAEGRYYDSKRKENDGYRYHDISFYRLFK